MLPQQSFSDKHTIETPEQMSLDFPVAGIGSRFLALAIDTLIQICAGVIVFTAVIVVFSRSFVRSPWILAALIAVVFLLMYGYFAAFEVLWNGQTPGKRSIGIRVVKDSGRPLTPSETIGRNLLRIIDQMPGFYAIGMLVALLSARNKRLGDLVAGSIVVREASLADIRPVWQIGDQSNRAASTPALGAAALSLEDLALIDTFLNRRRELPPDVRYRMAEQIFKKLRPKLTLPEPLSLGTESILEALAYERRSSGGY